MAEGGRNLYTVFEVDDISTSESVDCNDVTRDVAEALRALRGTSLRSDSGPSVGLTHPGLADDESSMRSSSCLSSYQDTTKHLSQAVGSRYEGSLSNMSFSRDGTTLSWASPDTVTTSWNMLIHDPSILFAMSHATPIVSFSSHQPAVDTNRDYVAKLEARLQHTESLLQKVLNIVDVATTANVERDVFPDAEQSSTIVRHFTAGRQLSTERQLGNMCSPTSSPVRQHTVVRQPSIVRQLDNERSPATSPVRQHCARQPSTRAPANSPERRRDHALHAPVSASSVAVRDTPVSTRRPGESHLYAGDDHRDRNVAKSYLPHVKLGVFKGDTSLETFLAKFENCSKYLNWNERDRFFHFSNALEGTAGQILWDATNCSSVEALIQLLRSRFGNQNQNKRFRALLKSRTSHLQLCTVGDKTVRQIGRPDLSIAVRARIVCRKDTGQNIVLQ